MSKREKRPLNEALRMLELISKAKEARFFQVSIEFVLSFPLFHVFLCSIFLFSRAITSGAAKCKGKFDQTDKAICQVDARAISTTEEVC